MTGALAHRGPDGDGTWLSGGVGLGHRRLAILDLSAHGRQPMVTPDGRFAITYNGEVYNHLELKAELESLGHAFRSRTDSEVVLHAYAEWGTECVTRFNGMFAFAVHDRDSRSVFLARDRYGVKPLYYCLANGSLLFASEQKAFLQHPGFRRELDLEGLVEYFTFQNFFTDKTLFKGVRILPAGCWAEVEFDGRALAVRPVRYWDFDFREPSSPSSSRDYEEELDRLFRQAVNRQMMSDVPVGAYLSSGMDSGSITAVAASQLPSLTTFTCGFDLRNASGLEMNFDERRGAELMSYAFKTRHYEMVLKAGDMERVLPSVAWAQEEPRCGQSYPNYYVAQLASKFVKVVFSGSGGDELFAGYPWRYYSAVLNTGFEDYIDNYYRFWKRLIGNQDLWRVFSPIRKDVRHVWTRDIFRSVFSGRDETLQSPADFVNHSLYFEAKTFLHGILNVEDKLSMAHGLETRVPFLDNDLVDFAMRVPTSLKLRGLASGRRIDENEIRKFNGYRTDGKTILRAVMKRHIPKAIAGRRKQGFSAPDASWFKGESIEYVKNTLYARSARIYDVMDPAHVQRLVAEHLEGRVNRRLFIWSLLNFEWWLRAYLA